jgi:hypothetical protein
VTLGGHLLEVCLEHVPAWIGDLNRHHARRIEDLALLLSMSWAILSRVRRTGRRSAIVITTSGYRQDRGENEETEE